MRLHRIIQIAGFAPDPDWSATQVPPPNSVIAESLGGTRIGSRSEGGRIYWVVIPYDGGTSDSKPTDGTAMTFDARLVYTIGAEYDGSGTTPLVIGRKSVGEVEGAPVAVGREILEFVPQHGGAATVQMTFLAAAGPATHLWIYWGHEKREGL